MNVKQYYMILGGSSVLSLGLGAAAGYVFAQRRLEEKFAAIATKEIAEAKRFYGMLNKKAEFATPESAVESLGLVDEAAEHVGKATDAVKALRKYRGDDGIMATVLKEAAPHVEDEHDNPTTEIDEDLDENGNFIIPDEVEENPFKYEEEIKHRTSEFPYVISREEFFENDGDNEQVSITYYAGDDVLVDERDEPIPDADSTVGDENLLRFGEGSGDRHIVYIRNETLNLDFEVAMSVNKYTEEVLGLTESSTSIKHSSDRRELRRFRGGRDE